jgi:hypothetical protein
MGKKIPRIVSQIIAITLLSLSAARADVALIVQFKNAPPHVIDEVEKKLVKEKLEKKVGKFGSQAPEEFARRQLKGIIRSEAEPSLAGIPVLYGGYVNYTDKDGVAEFPLRHDAHKIYMVLTPQLKFKQLRKGTVSHMRLGPPTQADPLDIFKSMPTKMLKLERQQDEKKIWFWKVSEEAVPETKRISKLSAIVLVNPHNLYVPMGEIIAHHSAHMILPPAYMLGKRYNDQVLLANLRLLRFFEQIKMKKESKKTDKGKIEQKLIQNH